jgi:hypothetical protein
MKQLLIHKGKGVAQRFFFDMEAEGMTSIDCPHGTISPISDTHICVAVHGVNKPLTTNKCKKLSILLNTPIDGETIYQTTIDKAVSIALILGAKKPKQISEENRKKLSDRMKAMKAMKDLRRNL